MNDQTVFQHRSFNLHNEVCFISFTQMSYGQAEKIFHWRNHPEIRKWMYHHEPIDLEDHFRYLAQLNGQSKNFYWLVGESGRPLGVVKLNAEGKQQGEWSFYLNPDYFETALGINLIYHTLNFFFHTLNLEEICSYVRTDNREATRLHDLFGIREDIMEERETLEGVDWFYKRSMTKEEWDERRWKLEDVKQRLLRKAG